MKVEQSRVKKEGERVELIEAIVQDDASLGPRLPSSCIFSSLFPYFVSISTSVGMPITYNGVSHDVATTFLRRRLLSSQWLNAAKTAAKKEMMIANEVFD
ncbi:hypothetical protein LSTR_LSTR014788 [Laodelphax striatellus]|uniref:Uncharacterized protein n=1 Tax=Laodelphax striatellus TaxID=195883 RepID=A0A482X444_LAOST|nr:hypothetical protein LSTR_LSTR014788 [Laodelphax striatellus]